MTNTGILRKMKTQWTDASTPIVYHMRLDKQEIPLNEVIGQTVKIRFTGTIQCIHCNRKINKSFAQGYCYPCFIRITDNAPCHRFSDGCPVAHEKARRCGFQYGNGSYRIDHCKFRRLCRDCVLSGDVFDKGDDMHFRHRTYRNGHFYPCVYAVV